MNGEAQAEKILKMLEELDYAANQSPIGETRIIAVAALVLSYKLDRLHSDLQIVIQSLDDKS